MPFPLLKFSDVINQARGNEKVSREGAGGCITASGNISLKLFMAPSETMELLIFWYVVAEYHIAQL